MKEEETVSLACALSMLATQKKANDSLVTLMHRRIEELNIQMDTEREENHLAYLWFTEMHPEMAEEFVAAAYARNPKHAKGTVAWLHDETLDLSTIPCTGKDFEPWN